MIRFENNTAKIALVYFDTLNRTEKCVWNNEAISPRLFEKVDACDVVEHIGAIGTIVHMYEMTVEDLEKDLYKGYKMLVANTAARNNVPYSVNLDLNENVRRDDIWSGKYGVESLYEMYRPNGVDYVDIFPASLAALDNDGNNWVGGGESYSFSCYDTIEEAIKSSNYLAKSIGFVDLNDNENAVADAVVAKLMRDKNYLRRFGIRTEGYVIDVCDVEKKEVIETLLYDEKYADKINIGNFVGLTDDKGNAIRDGIVVKKEYKNDISDNYHLPFLNYEDWGRPDWNNNEELAALVVSLKAIDDWKQRQAA